MTKAQDLHRQRLHDERINKCKKALELYKTGNYSISKLSKIFKTEANPLSRYIKENGINVENKQNKPRFNINVFNSIDTEEKAYWLGFLYADGYVSSTTNVVEVSLALKDKDHLEKYKKFLGYTGEVKTDHFRCRLAVGNKHFKNSLVNLKCIPKKSLVLKFPNKDIISDDLLYPFIRGYVDGDGTIYVSSKNKSVLVIIGTYEFLDEMLNRVKWKRNKFNQRKECKSNTYSLRWGGKIGMSILNLLYGKSCVHLERKYQKYLNFAHLYSNV